jgi:hypothetical protein
MLESPVLNSKGDRLTFDYTAADVPITPFAKLELDHFRRSDQGGYSFTSGTQIRFNQWVKGRIGVEAGWLTELWVPTYEIIVGVTI